MKMYTIIGLILVSLSTGLTNVVIGQEYTYLLQINSLSVEEQFFNLEISSKIDASPEPVIFVLSDQTTPFMRILDTGKHIIKVEQLGEQGLLGSKVTGFVKGESKGSAFADYRKTVLTAGPGGRYSAASQ